MKDAYFFTLFDFCGPLVEYLFVCFALLELYKINKICSYSVIQGKEYDTQNAPFRKFLLIKANTKSENIFFADSLLFSQVKNQVQL